MENSGPKILIVDDEQVVRDLLKDKLTSSGYNCATARDAFEALIKIRDDSFSVALCDIMMPGMDGIDLLKQINSIDPKVAVIMITAMGDAEIAVKSMKLGARDYITKPFNLDRIVISVERALERSKLLAGNTEYKHALESKVRDRAQQLEKKNKKLKALFLNSIKSLLFALEAKDEYIRVRSEKVAKISLLIAHRQSLPPGESENVKLAALLHDIGMIGIREDVLNKTDGFTDEQFEHIKSHSELGARILQPIKELNEIINSVKHHHEHFDGTGYPAGLQGTDIPLASRIIAVAETYVALTSPRAYLGALSLEKALDKMKKMKGYKLDPEIADVFLSLFEVEFSSDLNSREQEVNRMTRNISVI